jgi:heme/copper-type cytochrome/quinol oxidase subunit 2
MGECFPQTKRIKQERLTMSHGLSSFLGAITAWLFLAPVAFARKPLSMLSTLTPASTAAHHFVGSSLSFIWIAGGIFLVVSGCLAFAPFRLRARKSDPLSGRAQIYRSTEIHLAWTVIPVLVLLLLA